MDKLDEGRGGQPPPPEQYENDQYENEP